jgi:hypothetical protein
VRARYSGLTRIGQISLVDSAKFETREDEARRKRKRERERKRERKREEKEIDGKRGPSRAPVHLGMLEPHLHVSIMDEEETEMENREKGREREEGERREHERRGYKKKRKANLGERHSS